MNIKIGFIGCGNMSKAMIGGIIKNNIFKKEEILGSDSSSSTLETIKDQLGIQITRNNKEVINKSNLVVLAIKPQYYEIIIKEIASLLRPEHILITIAPGQTLKRLSEYMGKPTKIVRTMPNTPALVGEGMTGVCCNELVTHKELEYVCTILRSFGKAEIVLESQMDAVVAVSGSAPAYVFMLIEAMADGAVLEGMPRDKAYQFAAQTVLGSAKMLLETGKHPGELKDMVCSPGGTTIEAVRVLEEKGFRSSIMEAMKACTNKAKGL